MGKYANATCRECGIKRPVYLLKRKTIRKNSGSSGWSASFNLKKKDSLRFYTPRRRYTNSEQWFCKDNAAHYKPNYYVELEKKREALRIKKEQERIEKERQFKLEEERKEVLRNEEQKKEVERQRLKEIERREKQKKEVERQRIKERARKEK